MNGLLLAADWDAAFDAGLVTFQDDGQVAYSPRLSSISRSRLESGSLTVPRLLGLRPSHLPYLSFHRTSVWKST